MLNGIHEQKMDGWLEEMKKATWKKRLKKEKERNNFLWIGIHV